MRGLCVFKSLLNYSFQIKRNKSVLHLQNTLADEKCANSILWPAVKMNSRIHLHPHMH